MDHSKYESIGSHHTDVHTPLSQLRSSAFNTGSQLQQGADNPSQVYGLYYYCPISQIRKLRPYRFAVKFNINDLQPNHCWWWLISGLNCCLRAFRRNSLFCVFLWNSSTFLFLPVLDQFMITWHYYPQIVRIKATILNVV